MIFNRRGVLAGAITCAASFAIEITPASGGSFSLADWVDLGKVIGQVADGLDRAIDTIQHGSSALLAGFDVLNARAAKSRMLSLSGHLSDLHAANGMFVGSVDAYGDLWRQATARGTQPLNPAQTQQLQGAWRDVLDNIREILIETQAAMTELRSDRKDFAIDQSYRAIDDTLEQKNGLLARLSRISAPMLAIELHSLVDTEENFMKLRAALGRGIDTLNSFISRH